MSTAGSESRRELIRRRLAQGAGSASDPNAIAAATVAIWLQVSARLTPVIGARGVDILFKRTLFITKISLPAPAVPEDGQRGTLSFDDLKAHLERQEAPAAASCEFLFAFTVLLATLIGDSLTDRLLGPVWAPVLPASERKSLL